MPATESYFISWKGRRDGPYTLKELADMLAQGEIGLLHRVETAAGLVPLRDLLPAHDPGEFSKAPVEAGLTGQLPVPEPSLKSEPPPTAIESLDSERAARLYTICGLCFVFPPLAVWSWMLARQLANQGQPVTAARMKWMSIGLAAGGIMLWVLLWRLW